MSYIKAAACCGFFVVLTLHTAAAEEGSKPEAAAAQQQQDQPGTASTECYESIQGSTNLVKVENANPKFGYPNVKCSPTTGAVLWYGDPYTDTVPMGEMPKFGDETDGDFAQAVIRPRMKHFKTTMQCSGCHPSADQASAPPNEPRQLQMHQDIVSDSTKLQHGRGAIWCLDCHNAANRDTLVDRRKQAVSFDESHKVCGSCHGDTYSKWRMGLHGKRTGEWKVGGKKRWWTCTECHNPHTVQEHRFNPVKPELPPDLPRGMSSSEISSKHE